MSQQRSEYKQFSPEWYYFHLHDILSNYDQSIFFKVESTVISSIIDIISDYARGIRCVYLCESGYSSELANLCIIGQNNSDLHLCDSSFTIESWINLKFTSNEIQAIQGDQTIVGGRFLADQQALHITIRHGCPHFGFSLKNTIHNITALNCILQCNEWYHLACVYNIKTKEQLIYVNGKLEASKSKTEPLKGDRDLCISHFFQGRPLFGYITELRIWNIAQTKENIIKYMNKMDLTDNEIDAINNTKQGIILRKCFSMMENMRWVQRIKSKDEPSYDHLIQYCD